jgi:ubiquinone/menaquinone biosynthesis C-methylase UbiE
MSQTDDASEPFATLAQGYDQHRQGYSYAALNYIRYRTRLSPESTMLDLGCGTGLVLREFMGEVAQLYGLDISAAMLAEARRQCAQQPVGLVRGHGEALPFASACFDLVTMGQAIHWFDLSALMPQVHRVLKPGGWLVVLSKYPSPREPYRPLLEQLLAKYAPPTTTQVPRLTGANGVGNLLGLEAQGFAGYERVVFEWEVATPIEVYLAGSLRSPEAQALTTAQRGQLGQELQHALDRWAPDGHIREKYFDYLISARRTS